ncbi:ABC transporter substrate-binding protein [Paenibacillus sp.]|uniref:ABC transporter substrate-binding protein n=1 Tax=Paenibacillus sp. TaxID=58172 RepID=UPI002D6C2138|nr:ABC transporter substrate-binding protein [Paenibacillus sp.]HZG55998.1 ABC transporter substrate-binding protein [Paenibacillus sp.]
MKFGIRRRVSAILVMLAAHLTMAGCTGSWNPAVGSGDGNSQPRGAAPLPEDTVTIDFWFPWDGDYRRDFKKNVVDVFERTHPGIKVKLTFVENTGQTQASDKLLTAIAGGEAPDVALFDRFLIGSWAARGYLEDLSSYVEEAGIAPTDYYPSVWKEALYRGNVYGLPWRADVRAMYYNKTLMKNAGLNPNLPPKTIEELDLMAEAMFLKGDDGRYLQVGFVPWMNQGFFYTNAWNWGGVLQDSEGNLTPNDPQNVKALEWMAGYAKKYGIEDLTKFSEEMGKVGVNSFWTGKVGFNFDGNWILDDLAHVDPDFEWGIAPMPAAEGYEHVTWVGGWSYVMPKGAPHPEEAWEFIKFVAYKEGTLLWAQRENAGNDITVMPEVNAALQLSEHPGLRLFLDMMPEAYTRPVTPVGSLLWNESQRVQELAIHGRGEPQQLLDELKANVDAELMKVKP